MAAADDPVEAGGTVRRGRGLGGRAGWVLADQAISSLANAALSIVVARTVSPTEFGAFALAFSIYSLVSGLTYAVGGQVLSIRFVTSEGDERTRGAAAATGTAVLLGVVAALVVVPVGLALDMPLRSVLLAVGVLLPGLMLQGAWRTVFVARGSPKQAFTNDLFWVLLQAAFIGTLLLLSVGEAYWYVIAWGVAALLAAAWGARQARAVPDVRAATPFMVEHRDIVLPSVANAVAILGATQIAFMLMVVVSSVETIGALRAAQTLLGPLNIVGFALTSFAVPEIVRHDLSRRGLGLAALALSGAIVVMDLVWGGILLLLPQSAGEALLGETWTAARESLPGMVVYTACVGATIGATAVLRAMARVDYALWTSAALGPLVIVLSVAGAWAFGAAGAAWGLAAAGGAVIPLCWWLLVRAIRRREAAMADG